MSTVRIGVLGAALAAATLMALSGAQAANLLTNGSFESNYTGWTVTSRDANPAAIGITGRTGQGTTDGVKAVYLNSGQRLGNAVLSQTVTTASGTLYVAELDYGAYGAAGRLQELQVELVGSSTLVDDVVTRYGPGGGGAATTTFETAWFPFVADSASTLLRLSDLTTVAGSNSCDGDLDRVVIQPVLSTLSNAGFESGLDGWSVRSTNGSMAAAITVAGSEGYTEGANAAILNGGDLQGSAQLAQYVALIPGTQYVAEFDYGAYGVAGRQQQMQVEVTGASPLVDTTLNRFGPGSGASFDTHRIPFVPDSAVTRLSFADQTTAGNSASVDSLLDRVALHQVHPELVNGGFESGTSGWVITSTDGNAPSVSIGSNEGFTEGSQAAKFNAGQAAGNAVLSQFFAVAPGEVYEIEFDFGAYGAAGRPQDLLAEVIGASPLATLEAIALGPGNYDPANTTFETYAFRFVADSTFAELRLTDRTTLANSNSVDAVLDRISMSYVPEPATLSLLAFGGLGLAARRRRRQ